MANNSTSLHYCVDRFAENLRPSKFCRQSCKIYAPIDIGSSVSALHDWTYYDMEKSLDAVKSSVARYLARDDVNTLVESEIKGVRFDLLKCLDLYHSEEQDAQVKQLVIDPTHTDRQDNDRARNLSN